MSKRKRKPLVPEFIPEKRPETVTLFLRGLKPESRDWIYEQQKKYKYKNVAHFVDAWVEKQRGS